MAVRVSADPTFRLIGSKELGAEQPPRAERPASEENLLGLGSEQLVAQAEAPGFMVLDMDSTESPVHGQQEGSAYNGALCHPLSTATA